MSAGNWSIARGKLKQFVTNLVADAASFLDGVAVELRRQLEQITQAVSDQTKEKRIKSHLNLRKAHL